VRPGRHARLDRTVIGRPQEHDTPRPGRLGARAPSRRLARTPAGPFGPAAAQGRPSTTPHPRAGAGRRGAQPQDGVGGPAAERVATGVPTESPQRSPAGRWSTHRSGGCRSPCRGASLRRTGHAALQAPPGPRAGCAVLRCRVMEGPTRQTVTDQGRSRPTRACAAGASCSHGNTHAAARKRSGRVPARVACTGGRCRA
jgi:hypothetical protein